MANAQAEAAAAEVKKKAERVFLKLPEATNAWLKKETPPVRQRLD